MDRQTEFAAKHARIRDYLARTGLDAVLLATRHNFSWATCGAHNYVCHASAIGNSYVLIDADRAVVIANNIEAPRLAGEELFDALPMETFFYADGTDQAALLTRLIAGRKVATDAPISGVEAPRLAGDFDTLRYSLLDSELTRMRLLSTDAVAAIESTCRTITPGQTENAIAGQLACALRSDNMTPWVLLIAVDDRLETRRHPLPTNKVMNRHAMLVVGAERDGLVTACSRIVSFEPLSDELIDKHHAVATVETALWSRTLPGVTFGDMFATAQAAYAQTGYPDQWKLHHQGGPLGYQPRDAKASPGDPTIALENQAFAWNPSITGTKSEDSILCTATGPEKLADDTDWPVIEVDWKGFSATRPDILVR
jgi:Xaa-Pro aminopeptidase